MKQRFWTEEMIDELKRLRRLGHSFGQIARRLGVTRNAAIGKAMRIGLRVRVRRQSPEMTLNEPAPIGTEREILGNGVCHWISGDVGGAWRMCGHPSSPGSSWCKHHFGRVYDSIVGAGAQRDAA